MHELKICVHQPHATCRDLTGVHSAREENRVVTDRSSSSVSHCLTFALAPRFMFKSAEPNGSDVPAWSGCSLPDFELSSLFRMKMQRARKGKGWPVLRAPGLMTQQSHLLTHQSMFAGYYLSCNP